MSIRLISCMILASLGASAAVASDPEPFGIEVYFGDLDLTRPAGEAALHSRIARAVERLCPVATPFVPRSANEARRCRRQASARADEAVRSAVARAQQRVLARQTQLAAQ